MGDSLSTRDVSTRGVATLPRWDVSAFFPSLGSRELATAQERVLADLDRLGSLYEEHDVRDHADPLEAPTDADVAAFEAVLDATNATMEQIRFVGAYLYAFVSTDARDDEASSQHTRFQTSTVALGSLLKRFNAWVAWLGPDALADRSLAAQDHAFPLAHAAVSAERQMSEAEEDLAGELRLTGSAAWSRLHRDVSARLTGDLLDADGTRRTLPITVLRGLATDPDPATRRAAYDAELEAWDRVAVPLAAALNGAKGEAAVLGRRRGFADALEPALLANRVDRPTLDAMHDAVRSSFPDFRRYLRAKADLVDPAGRGGLAWWDLLAPVVASEPVDWDAATHRVREAFASYSPPLAQLAGRAMDEQWIDAEPREGKSGGAFCMPVIDGVSRVLLNFDGSPDGVQTLAHELGHAYHNTNLADRTPLQRQTPMALAETASIFCETIMVEASLHAAEGDQRLALLDTDLAGSCQVVVDIHSRFLFEMELCRVRTERTLSVDELSAAMLEAQAATYGDGLRPDTRHRYMWAVKNHYFTPFYNWPYTFGLLFGLGLYARYLDDADRFRAGYDSLLADTGLDDAAGLAARFDIDVRSEAFWQASLDVLRRRIDEFVHLAGGNAGGQNARSTPGHA